MTDEPRPRVSIVIRTKDRPHLLARALRSIQAQTFDEWEAVIVNDGGDPQLVDEVIGALSPKARQRTRQLHQQTSVGRWPSANAGVAGTTAPLIVLHDDDDTWHPEFLARTVAYLDAHPDEHAVAGRIEVIVEEDREGVFVEVFRYLLEEHHDQILLTDLLKFNRFVPIGFLYRRELHRLIGRYDESLPAAGDWAFNLAVLSLQPLRYAGPSALAYWHQRPSLTGALGNSVHAATEEHKNSDRFIRDKALRSYAQQAGLGLPLYLASAFADVARQFSELDDRLAETNNLIEGLTARAGDLEKQIIQVLDQNERLLYNQSRTIDTRLRGWVFRQKQRFRRLR